MNRSERAGPVVWTGIIAATCVLLLVVQQMLWLALPFLFGGVLHYILVGPMQRLVRGGYGRNAAAMLVCLGFFAFLTLALTAAFSWSRGPEEESWEQTVGLYLDGGIAFVHNTLTLLEKRFPLLAEMHLTSTVNGIFRTHTDNFAEKHLGEILVALATWVPSLLLAPFLTFFFLRDGLRFKKFLARAVPNA